MLHLHDIRESRAYQEAVEEGLQKGLKEGMKEATAKAIVGMAAENMTAAKIAAILKVDIELVQQVLATGGRA